MEPHSLLKDIIVALLLCIVQASTQELLPVVTVIQISSLTPEYAQTASKANLTYISANEAEYQVPSEILNLGLHCSASYPVTWRLDSFKYAQVRVFGTIGTHRREAANPFDYQSLKYSAGLTLRKIRNLMTGRYVCQSTRNSSVFVGVHIFWSAREKNYDTDLVIEMRHNLTLSRSDLTGDSIVLPCLVSNPDQKVNLIAYDLDDRMRALPESSYTYDPKIGFTVRNWQSGYYLCSVPLTTSANTYLGIFVPTPVNIRRTTEPSITVDATRKIFKCCSGTRVAPRMAFLRCEQPMVCDYFGQVNPVGIARLLNTKFVRRKRNGCTILRRKPDEYHITSGIVRCIGTGFDIYQPYVDSLVLKLEGSPSPQSMSSRPVPKSMWLTWSEIVPEEMILIGSLKDGDSKIDNSAYVGESLKIICFASPYYFSAGIVFGIQYRNNTTEFISNPNDDLISTEGIGQFNFDDGHSKTIELTVNENIDFIFCKAPVWNSSAWDYKPLRINIKKADPPHLEAPQKHFVWSVNDTNKEILCYLTGYPLPRARWLKNDEDLENGTYVVIGDSIGARTNETRSRLRILRISELDRGVYKCVGESNVGNATLEFRVDVLGLGHGSSNTQVGKIVGGIAGGVIVVASIVILMVWQRDRLKLIWQGLCLKLINTRRYEDMG